MSYLFVDDSDRMQVEVSKHTEGSKEKALRPNGLHESLIRYDGINNGHIFHLHTYNVMKNFTKL